VRGGALDAFLDELESPAPSPCGGTAAAVTAAMAASLVTMVARGSAHWEDGAGIASQSRALRSRLTALGDEDAAAFAHVLRTMHDRTGTPEQRDFALGLALLRAAEAPLRIAEAAADVAELAAAAAAEGSPHLQPDATAAAALAEAATQAATHLVEINLAIVPGDSHSERAGQLTAAAAAARARALGAR
jgi:glutamate formiminotransferase/formiminotetrahydrofolate cyclodeaminase